MILSVCHSMDPKISFPVMYFLYPHGGPIGYVHKQFRFPTLFRPNVVLHVASGGVYAERGIGLDYS